MSRNQRSTKTILLLGGASLVTVVVHAVFLPRYFPEDALRSVPYLVVGWGSYAIAFYGIGRLFAPSSDLPNMRLADLGLGIVLVSGLLSGLLDTIGFTPEAVPEAHALPAVGIYVGLALLGWSIGQRSTVIERILSENEAT